MDRATIQRRVAGIVRFKSLYKLEELLATAYGAGFSDCAKELAGMQPRDVARVLRVTRKGDEDDE